jgi:catechol 2,3-dioxygenase-like lactoylglutathione lyase family enzyme
MSASSPIYIPRREAHMIRLRKIDHVCLRVGDVGEAAARYAIQFGLTVRELGSQRATLACDYERCSLELVAAEPGAELGFDHCAWQLRRSVPLTVARDWLASTWEAWEDRGDHLSVTDPEGFEHHVLPYEHEADRRPAVARSTAELPGLRPRKLGHVNRLTGDMEAVTRFHTDVLGMEISDYLGDAGTWFHVNAEHHQMALVAADRPHFHHLAFDYVDLGALRSLFDNLGQHGRWLSWGPVRHGIAQNMCGYVRITEEPLHVECYCDMEQLEPEHEPRTFPDDRFSSNTWGPLPPRSYFRFDAAAIESERESLETRGTPLPPVG